MTTLATLAVPVRQEEDASVRPLPWRRMAWVTWRQHRTALTGMAALLGALAVYLWFAGLQLHHAYAAATACHPAGSLACGDLINTFDGKNGFLTNGLILQIVPALIGAFVGAPVLAREIESGTFRFTWTQGFGRWRWTLAKLVLLAGTVAATAGAISVLFSWYYQPYFPAGNQALPVNKEITFEASAFAPGLFDLRGVSFAAWTLAAFALAALAGMLIRRVVPAIVTALAVYAALAIAAGGFLRQHYLTPFVTTSLNVPSSAWIVSQQWTKGGRPVSQSVLSQVLQGGGPLLAGKGGVPKAPGAWQYLVQHGYTLRTTYQPASRFWPFQWIEGVWLLALSLLLIAVTVWLVRRRVV
jgi:ABC-type transport system involved in multi-copper enzyme maturation permease subunit